MKIGAAIVIEDSRKFSFVREHRLGVVRIYGNFPVGNWSL